MYICIWAIEKNAWMDFLKHLEDIGLKTDMPWLILGDFNCIANLNERIGSTPRLTETLSIRHHMENYGLYDVKSNGRFFTWNNKQAEDLRVMSKINRVMANQQWRRPSPILKPLSTRKMILITLQWSFTSLTHSKLENPSNFIITGKSKKISYLRLGAFGPTIFVATSIFR